jgi:acyl-coenzyme A thioesterase PaaI-like protein
LGFSEATRVEHRGGSTWTAAIEPGWDIGGNANGGYLLVLAARAMALATGSPDPVSVTAHYLRPGKAGPVRLEAEAVRVGRRFATATALLLAGETPLLQTVGSFGDLTQAEGPERVDAAPPELPDPDDCVRIHPDSGKDPSFMSQVDLRLHPEDAGFREGLPSGEPRVRGWFRFPDAEPVDTLGLLLAVDSFPPTVFNARLPVGWAPTLELTAQVHARPQPGWLRCAFSTRVVTGGFLTEEGELWDAGGRLVAQSRQLALVPRAKP